MSLLGYLRIPFNKDNLLTLTYLISKQQRIATIYIIPRSHFWAMKI